MKQLLIYAWILGAFISSHANTASLGVWPINPRIETSTSSTLLWVKNNSRSESIVLQARVLLWRQSDNQDQLEQQDDLVVSPPIITVKPGVQQLFRIVNRGGIVENSKIENSYRVLIDEVPSADVQKKAPLSFQMRYSLPLFGGSPKDLSFKPLPDRLKVMQQFLHYQVGSTPSPYIEVFNSGGMHVRLSNVRIDEDSRGLDDGLISKGLLGYVLPNSSRKWPLSQTHLSPLLKPNAVIKFEQEHQELTIVKR